MDGLSGNNARGLELDSLAHVTLDGTLAVNGVAEGVDNTSEHAFTDGDIHDRTSSLDNITFLDLSISNVQLSIIRRNQRQAAA